VHDGQVNPARARLYLDEDVPVQIAAPLRRAGFNVLTARDAGRLRATNESQLDFAATEQPVVITRKRNGFLRRTAEFAAADRPTTAS